ncbi:hypothetical protein KR98_22735 [Ralstonia solanacearum]|nr:hypothetical protein KR98_22735 [Ralstonia solanacearum]OCQ70897.1 hypothetical protein AR465_19375 [Ralstonia solanacearum]
MTAIRAMAWAVNEIVRASSARRLCTLIFCSSVGSIAGDSIFVAVAFVRVAIAFIQFLSGTHQFIEGAPTRGFALLFLPCGAALGVGLLFFVRACTSLTLLQPVFDVPQRVTADFEPLAACVFAPRWSILCAIRKTLLVTHGDEGGTPARKNGGAIFLPVLCSISDQSCSPLGILVDAHSMDGIVLPILDAQFLGQLEVGGGALAYALKTLFVELRVTRCPPVVILSPFLPVMELLAGI